jgi:transcriptional regulator with XRE-family HTH domain
LHKAQQRSADYNLRYGAAIRKLREDAGISQSQVSGITQRQLRRIEKGQCRATANALHDLANAHGLEVNVYMEKLAKTM